MSADEEPSVLRHVGASIRAIAFSPDGKKLASADYRRVIRVWDLETGEFARLDTGSAYTDAPLAVWQGPDALITADADGTLWRWDLVTGETNEIGSLPNCEPIANSRDAQLIVAVADDNSVLLHAWETGQDRVLAQEQTGLYSAAFSPRGDRLALGFLDGDVKVCEVDTGQLRTVHRAHSGPVRSLAFSPDGDKLASGGDRQIHLWDIRSGQRDATLVGHSDGVRGLAFSPDGTMLATVSIDATVKLWDLSTSKVRITLRGHADSVRCVTFSPDGKTLASADSDRTIRLWRAATDQEVDQLLPLAQEQYPHLFRDKDTEPMRLMADN